MDFLKLIQEGRVDDFKAKYSKKFGGENVDRIVKSVPQKFLDWVGKHLDTVNFEDNFVKLSDALNKFEKISTNLTVTDLFQYKNVGQLLSAISQYENRQRREVRKVDGGNVVYDDGRYFVVNPLSHESSCYYGKGTKWCTAAETDTHFKRYNEDGKLFYILDRTLSTSDPLYKVAILQKFDGDKTYYDAKDEIIRSGWIFNTNKLNEILKSTTDYLNSEYAEQVKIYSDKEAAKKEKERLERLRLQRLLQDRRDEAQERRIDGEWELGPNCPEVGLKAHALLNYLIENNEVEAITNEDRNEINRIENEIQRLQNEYDNDEDVRTDLLDEIGELEDEVETLKGKIDVYNIIPTGRHYDTTEFVVIDSPDIEGNTYAVGDEGEMESSCYDYVDNLIDDIGYNGFSKGFANGYIDEDAVVSYAEDLFDQDVRDSPESYFDDDQRMLSDDQEEKIQILKSKIEQTESLISRYEDSMDGGEDDDDYQEKIDDLNERIEEMNDEITEIEEDPEGDFPEELIEDTIQRRVQDVKYDIEEFMNEWGLDLEDYIDKDEFIKGVIDADGYGNCMSTYDGNADEQYVQDELFYVMRID